MLASPRMIFQLLIHALQKAIVKFARTNFRNEFYAERKVLAAKNLREDPILKSFLVGRKIYISGSLTPQRKKTLW